MRDEDVLFWLRAQPFVPFRMVMNSGRTYEVRHPEMLRVLRTSLVIFRPTDRADVYEAEMIGSALIDHIEPVDAQTRA